MTAGDRFRKVAASAGHVTVEPIPSQDELDDFYRRAYYQQQASASYQASYDEGELAYKRLIATQIVDSAAGFMPSAGTLLEVGCGEGFVLAAAKARGWKVLGLDLTDFALRTWHPELLDCLRIGDVHPGIQGLADAQQRFEIIVLQNVLEHVRQPDRVLRELRPVVAPNGVISATLPNDESPLQRRLRALGSVDHDYWFVPPQHLHYFNIETGKAFAASCGYETIDIYSDFPIEFFLFHPGSNYVSERSNGKGAHRARVEIMLELAKSGPDNYHALCRAFARCGIGRAFTMLLRPRADA